MDFLLRAGSDEVRVAARRVLRDGSDSGGGRGRSGSRHHFLVLSHDLLATHVKPFVAAWLVEWISAVTLGAGEVVPGAVSYMQIKIWLMNDNLIGDTIDKSQVTLMRFIIVFSVIIWLIPIRNKFWLGSKKMKIRISRLFGVSKNGFDHNLILIVTVQGQ